jgi:hypothetical protein
MYWRKFSGFSPIGESAEGILANVWWTFANGESPICEILIGEVPVTPLTNDVLFRKPAPIIRKSLFTFI